MSKKRINIVNAIKYGDLFTRLSVLLMGLGVVFHGQIVKGLLIFACEIGFVLYMLGSGLHNLSMLPSLGTVEEGKVWNEAKQVYEYTTGDNSQQLLLYGVITCFVIAAIIVLWVLQLRHSYRLQVEKEEGRKVPTFIQDVKSLFDGNLHITLMTLPCLGILVFNIVPLVYMISMAFTNYSKEDEH
ncbi:MAG: sugar ABC transporter permease, partial [Oscillospiraceae bacterium]|nr:sugar ABC transporter permease [Oscillospiraceae bacterium]